VGENVEETFIGEAAVCGGLPVEWRRGKCFGGAVDQYFWYRSAATAEVIANYPESKKINSL
jgi:hypothetical protein